MRIESVIINLMPTSGDPAETATPAKITVRGSMTSIEGAVYPRHVQFASKLLGLLHDLQQIDMPPRQKSIEMPDAERTVSLRKLVEAKDAAVDVAVPKE